MAKLPTLAGKQAVAAFVMAGWTLARQRGSHIILIKLGHIASLSVPDHKELAKGTLRGLLRAAGLTVEEFVELLD